MSKKLSSLTGACLSLAVLISLTAASSDAMETISQTPGSLVSSGILLAQNLPPLQQPAYPQPGYQQPSYQQPAYPQQGYQQPSYQAPLQGRVVTAPAGSYVTGTLTSPVSSEFARVGDRFTATLGSDLAAGGSVILPAGSQLEAQVVSVTKAGRAGRNGELDIRFTSAIMPNGQRIPMSARIQTEDGTGLIKGGTTAGRIGKAALKTGLGAGLGAALGTAMGPLSGGEVGRGAIYGTAIGGGVGALAAAWQKGADAVLPGGQPLNIVLDQPLTITPPAYGAYPQQSYPQQGYPAQSQPYPSTQSYPPSYQPNPYGYGGDY